jgi:hypothetical protein
MKLKFIKKLGDGSFADVWLAKDDLDREVAVKIIREANVLVVDAMMHAKALAKINHDNVVKVFSLEKVTDPESGELVDGVVMELINGITLDEMLKGKKLSGQEVKNYGIGIINGLIQIQNQGMAHGDLHSENIMIENGNVKIIDILYLESLSVVSTKKLESRIKDDQMNLRVLINHLLVHSEFGPLQATEFNNMLGTGTNCEEMLSAFLKIVETNPKDKEEKIIEELASRISDPDYIEGEAYAKALDEETPENSILPLLIKVVDENIYQSVHQDYIQALWDRLSTKNKKVLLNALDKKLNSTVPKGKWTPSLRLLKAFYPEGWSGLSKITQLKLEGLITKDILAGHYDIHRMKPMMGGQLGTYARRFWRKFSEPNNLANNLISLLEHGWYTQNYVGHTFMAMIPKLAKVTGREKEFIEAIRYSVDNDAREIKKNLGLLPDQWIDEINDSD